MLSQQHDTPLLSAKLCRMYLNSSISVSIILNGLQTRKITSTGLRVSGHKPSAMCASLMVFQRSILGYFKEYDWRFNNPKPQAQLRMIK